MSLKLGPPGDRYNRVTQASNNQKIEAADAFNMKTNGRNVLGGGASIVLQASDGSYHTLVVSPAGVLSTTPVTP